MVDDSSEHHLGAVWGAQWLDPTSVRAYERLFPMSKLSSAHPLLTLRI